MKPIEKNSNREIVDRPKDKKCKFDRTLEQYKGRLVAKGYTQIYGINYEETFAPVAKNMNLHQFDVKNAFLHGDPEEEVYMDIPLGFYSHNEKNKVCKLKKTLYELKQSPQAWFGRFGQVMISLRYKQRQGDHTLFIKHSLDGKLTLLLVYVNNMIVIGDDEIEKLTLKEKLSMQFEMKEIGKLKCFLGIEIVYSKQGIFISERKYVLNLLKETGKLECKTSRVLIEQNHKTGCEESPIIEKSQYQRLLGKLIYLSHTRSDIAYLDPPVFEVKSGKRTVVQKRSKKQNVVARSSVEVMDEAKCVQHDGTKHIEIDRHFIKEKLNSELVVIAHVPTGLQVADVFTKRTPCS
ncbi:hypothetical protein CR513_05363, partial [Mucuna pruriens]